MLENVKPQSQSHLPSRTYQQFLPYQHHHHRPFPSQPPPLSPAASWSTLGLSNNQFFRMVNGNISGYNIGMWNCRRGLIDGGKRASHKKVEVLDFLQKHKLHMLCLIEAGLHGEASRHRRVNPLATKDIHTILGIPGYKLLLPSSWQAHGQARLLVIAREELQVKIRDQGVQSPNL